MKTAKELEELFESGSLLHRDWSGHEQMLMNEGTFVALALALLSESQQFQSAPKQEVTDEEENKPFTPQEMAEMINHLSDNDSSLLRELLIQHSSTILSSKSEVTDTREKVVDWELVLDKFCHHAENSGKVNLLDFIEFLKQHYTLPTDSIVEAVEKELSEITDEDLTQLARIHYKEYDEVTGKNIHEMLRRNTKATLLSEIDKMGIKAYQYLQSKNYKLPKYF